METTERKLLRGRSPEAAKLLGNMSESTLEKRLFWLKRARD